MVLKVAALQTVIYPWDKELMPVWTNTLLSSSKKTCCESNVGWAASVLSGIAGGVGVETSDCVAMTLWMIYCKFVYRNNLWAMWETNVFEKPRASYWSFYENTYGSRNSVRRTIGKKLPLVYWYIGMSSIPRQVCNLLRNLVHFPPPPFWGVGEGEGWWW